MSYWQEKFTIGSLSFPRFIGGPLDGITDSPFRQLVREFSKDELMYTEMRHVACVANDKTGRLSMNFLQSERPLSYQVAACKEEYIDEACHKIMAAGVDIIDLNIGCPAKNVVKSGSGSALMADLPRLKRILDKFRTNLNIPFTVKIRAGFKEKNAVEVAKLIQDCGADALAIHPRLRAEMFAGIPDYALAGQVKRAVTIPVLLSGNVVNAKTAQMAYAQTGVDGFLIGRGIWGKPWKLHEMQCHVEGKEFIVDQKLIFTYAVKHLDALMAYYGPKGLHCFRKHLPFYLQRLPNAAMLRKELVSSESVEHVRQLLVSMIG